MSYEELLTCTLRAALRCCLACVCGTGAEDPVRARALPGEAVCCAPPPGVHCPALMRSDVDSLPGSLAACPPVPCHSACAIAHTRCHRAAPPQPLRLLRRHPHPTRVRLPTRTVAVRRRTPSRRRAPRRVRRRPASGGRPCPPCGSSGLRQARAVRARQPADAVEDVSHESLSSR